MFIHKSGAEEGERGVCVITREKETMYSLLSISLPFPFILLFFRFGDSLDCLHAQAGHVKARRLHHRFPPFFFGASRFLLIFSEPGEITCAGWNKSVSARAHDDAAGVS